MFGSPPASQAALLQLYMTLRGNNGNEQNFHGNETISYKLTFFTLYWWRERIKFVTKYNWKNFLKFGKNIQKP